MDMCHYCDNPASASCINCGKDFCKKHGNAEDELCTDCLKMEEEQEELI